MMIYAFLCLMMVGCQSVFGSGWFSKGSKEKQSITTKLDDKNLSLVNLQARILELESKVNAQAQTIKVLEKSLVLGISPELYIDNQEQRNFDADNSSYVSQNQEGLIGSSNTNDQVNQRNQDNQDNQDNQADQVNVDKSSKPLAKNNAQSSYDKQFQYAKELYDNESYGQAIVEFSDVLKRYPDKDPQVKYWIGMCWYKLKEYNLASKAMMNFIRDNPNHPLTPQAKLCIADSWLDQGYFEKAVKEYKDIIETYPKDPVSKVAKQQILNAGKNL